MAQISAATQASTIAKAIQIAPLPFPDLLTRAVPQQVLCDRIYSRVAAAGMGRQV